MDNTYHIIEVDHANGHREWAIRRESDGRVAVFEESSRVEVEETAALILAGEEDAEDYFGD